MVIEMIGMGINEIGIGIKKIGIVTGREVSRH